MSAAKFIIFAIIVAGVLVGGVYYSKRLDQRAEEENRALEEKTKNEEAALMEKLQIKDVVVGTGEEAQSGMFVTVNYVGTLENGEQFESSYGKTPFTFELGVGKVIRGWDLGVQGMKVGGKRELTIPPELGYGGSAVGQIPPNSTLHFAIELLKVSTTE